MNQIELFTFEAIPEPSGPPLSYYLAGQPPSFAMPPMFRVRVRYGGRDYAYNFSAYNDDMMLTESFLEHFLRRALDEFRKCTREEERKRKRETIDRHKTALLSAVDDYTDGAR